MPLAQIDYQTLAEFRFLLRRFLHFSEKAASRAGLTPTQHQALLVIQGQTQPDSVSIRLLAQQLLLEHHSVVGLVDRLQQVNLVQRHDHPTDKRQVLVRLTVKGKRTLEKLSASHRQELAKLSPELRKALRQVEYSAQVES
jgi:DNA-binding MarR family transcriptional regulator